MLGMYNVWTCSSRSGMRSWASSRLQKRGGSDLGLLRERRSAGHQPPNSLEALSGVGIGSHRGPMSRSVTLHHQTPASYDRVRYDQPPVLGRVSPEVDLLVHAYADSHSRQEREDPFEQWCVVELWAGDVG